VLAMVQLAVGSRELLVLVLFDLTLLVKRFSVSFNLFSSLIFAVLSMPSDFLHALISTFKSLILCSFQFDSSPSAC
jgi:hypothetical protein